MTIPSPGTLDELRAITDPATRARAATAYIDAREGAINQARLIRDIAIALLLASDHSTTEVADISGMSVGHVKAVKRWPTPPKA